MIGKPNQRKDTKYLNPFGDIDLDGVPNWKDCSPFDPTKQDLVGDIKKAGSTVKKAGTTLKKKVSDFLEEREEQKEEYEKKVETYSYIIALTKEGKWINVGAYSKDKIYETLLTIKNDPTILDAVISDDPKEADKRNRAQAIEYTKEGIGKAGAVLDRFGQASKKFAEDQMLIAKENYAKQPRTPIVERIKQGPSGVPPASKGWWGNMAEKQQIPMDDMNYYQDPDLMLSKQRKLPPKVKRYTPVSKQQSFVMYKPVGQQMRRPSRPRGMMPIARIQFMKFGRRVRE